MSNIQTLAVVFILCSCGFVEPSSSEESPVRQSEQSLAVEDSPSVDDFSVMSSTCTSADDGRFFAQALHYPQNSVVLVDSLEMIGEDTVVERNDDGTLESQVTRLSLARTHTVISRQPNVPNEAVIAIESTRTFRSNAGVNYREQPCNDAGDVLEPGSLSSRVLSRLGSSVALLIEETAMHGYVVRGATDWTETAIVIADGEQISLASLREAVLTDPPHPETEENSEMPPWDGPR